MKRITVLVLLSVLAAVLGQIAGAQSPPGPVGPTPAPQQQDPQSKPPQPTPSPPDQSDGVTQPARPPGPPVLRGANRDLIERKTSSKDAAPEEVGEGDVVRVSTTLISIPVSVMDRDGKYIPNLRKEDFRIWEDGAEQQVAYFASTEKPFTVGLMIDTSDSTRFRLQEIQDAAIWFVEQLRPDDRVMVVSFGDKIKVLSQPTSDRKVLREAIRQTKRGSGTRLFDAVDQVINIELRRVEGRKAVVLFTDGVDTTSKHGSYYRTVRDVEEFDALVYPVKYDTYSDLILDPDAGGGKGGRGAAGTTRAEYERGDRYLHDLARVSGARLYDAGQENLDYAFRLVAEELRRQYSVGYYPKKIPQPGDRRKIKVRVNKPDLVVRTRDSYTFQPRVKASTQGVTSQPKSPD
jgi:Ca-activated chloride channel family protein